ncbi:MAG TPA: YdeI/OmpD-associated family protein [Cryomorphaceae bacterium]|nr:YdeI/OmpD-associated family protein [Cryomorphaceae bacterium]
MEEHAVVFTTTLEKTGGDLWGYCFYVPESIAESFKASGIKRVCCSVNESDKLHVALMPSGKGTTFVTLNKTFCKKHALLLGQELNVAMEEDRSKYGMAFPEELEAVFDADPAGFELFEKLTPGKQRNLIHFVASVKSTDIRIRRALVVSAHLIAHRGKIDFKDLMDEMKAANRNEKLY